MQHATPSPPPDLWPRFARLAVVNILSNLLVPIAGLIDTAFLGHLDDIRFLAGVSLATVVFSYLYWTFGFLRMGTTGLTAQAVGRHDVAEMYLVLLRHGGLAIAIGLVLVILQAPLQQLSFALLSAQADVEAAGQAYFQALIWGAPATLLNFVLLGWFLGRAEGRWVLLLSAVNNLSNVGLNYWFIVGLGWASAGAGAATALSQGLMLGVGLVIVACQCPWAQLQGWLRQWRDTAAIARILRLNRDILIRTFALLSVFATFTNLSGAIGTETLAVNALLLQVVTLSAYFIDGIAFATESLVGQLSGQAHSRQLKQVVLVSGSVATLVGLAIASVFNLFPHTLFSLLTSHTTLLDQAQQTVPWLLPVLTCGAWAYILDGYFLGLTQGHILRQAALVSAIGGFAPFAAIAALTQTVHWLWIGLTGFMVARTITLGWHLPATWSTPPLVKSE